MAISEFWVGEIPARPLEIEIVDSDNNPMPLDAYSEIKARLLGSDNEEVDVTGMVVNQTEPVNGILAVRWPADRSLFNKAGEYLLQIELNGATGSREFTDAHTIRVRKFGGKN